MSKKSPEKIATLRTLAADGCSASEIARSVGVSLPTIINWAAEELIPLLTKSQALKKAMADPDVRARKSAAMKLVMADPDVRARKSAAMKLVMADPDVRARHAAAMADPDVRARKSAAMKLVMADPDVRARHAAAMADPDVRARIKASRMGAKGILIPKWIPPSLHDEFLEVAAFDGEEKAASHIRALKREMAGILA